VVVKALKIIRMGIGYSGRFLGRFRIQNLSPASRKVWDLNSQALGCFPSSNEGLPDRCLSVIRSVNRTRTIGITGRCHPCSSPAAQAVWNGTDAHLRAVYGIFHHRDPERESISVAESNQRPYRQREIVADGRAFVVMGRPMGVDGSSHDTERS
jgi:hypothetical protein